MTHLDRRTFILGGAGAIAGIRRPADPFSLGVASGDPDADSVVLWTRLAPSPLAADGHGGMSHADVDVDWQVSATDSFAAIVASGTATARYADAHTLHVVAGGLAPDAEYFYRFRTGGHLSPVGRTRTAPSPGTIGRDLLMLFASCSNFEAGYFTAYRRMAEERPDLILHLGDYIYEGGGKDGHPRRHLGPEILTLAGYRRRYGQYKQVDPDVQAAHACAPWLVVPDDHDVENDYAGMHRLDNVPPLSPAQWVARRSAAYRAYYEHLPLRPAAAPVGNRLNLYRRIRWGRLATFHMLDTRQFRDAEVCGGGWKKCADADRTDRSMPGRPEEAWLLDGLAQHEATWDLIGQQVFFAGHLNGGVGNMDAWDGYRASRDRLQQGWVDRKVRNPVVLTGDIHSAWANDLKADYDDNASPTIGAELVCTSISSGGDGTAATAIPGGAAHPHLKFFSDRRGYSRTRITPAQLTADFRAVGQVTRPGAPAYTVRSFAVLDGRPGLEALG